MTRVASWPPVASGVVGTHRGSYQLVPVRAGLRALGLGLFGALALALAFGALALALAFGALALAFGALAMAFLAALAGCVEEFFRGKG